MKSTGSRWPRTAEEQNRAKQRRGEGKQSSSGGKQRCSTKQRGGAKLGNMHSKAEGRCKAGNRIMHSKAEGLCRAEKAAVGSRRGCKRQKG